MQNRPIGTGDRRFRLASKALHCYKDAVVRIQNLVVYSRSLVSLWILVFVGTRLKL